MAKTMQILLQGELLDEHGGLTLSQLCRLSHMSAEQILELVEYGALEPQGREITAWRFSTSSIRRAQCARRLREDLGLNAAGAALALDLLDELERLRERLRRLEG